VAGPVRKVESRSVWAIIYSSIRLNKIV